MKKRRVETFSLCDRRGIERHLEKMAEKGWMIEKISTMFWTYRRIEPQKVHFCVTFYPDASDFAPGPSEEQQEFQEFCAHTGWNLTVSRGQMRIFCNERENPVPIETEPEVEIDAIHEGMVKMTLIPYGILLVLSLMMGGFILLMPLSNPIDALADPSILFIIFDYTALFLLCIVEIFGYLHWRYRAKKAAAQGEFLESGRWMSLTQRILLLLLLVGAAGYLICLGARSEADMIRFVLMTAAYFAGLGLVNAVRNGLREQKVSSGVNKVLTLVFSFIFLSLFYTGIIWATLSLADSTAWGAAV